MSLRPVAALVLVALIAGAIAARADSGGAPRPARAPARVAPPPTRPSAAAVPPLAYGCAAPMAVNPKQPVPKPAPPSTAPPSQALLDAFAILRRARTDEDALPSKASQALRARGLSPVSPDSARLLRSTPSGGKAWVVPVPNVVGRFGIFCEPGGKPGAREGLAVVAVGDAASGGGGALDDLVRGRSPVTVAPCAGADHTMLSISGIVPNGVGAVYLTAPDGTAVRADVKDNGYEFLLPNQRSYEQRYVVDRGRRDAPRPARRHLRRRASKRVQGHDEADAVDGPRVPGRPLPVRDATGAQPEVRHAGTPAVAGAAAPPGGPDALRHAMRDRRPVRARRGDGRPGPDPGPAGRRAARAGPGAVRGARPAPPGAHRPGAPAQAALTVARHATG